MQKKMENVTATSNATFAFALPELWTGDMVILAMLTVFTTYVATSLIYHNVKVSNRKNKTFLQLSLEKKFAVISKYICILIAVISVIKNASATALLVMERIAISNDFNMLQINSVEIACNNMPRIGISALNIGITLMYLFLWLRQKILYIHPFLNILNNRSVKAISWGIVFVWLLYCFITIPVYFIVVQYQFGLDQYRGCFVSDDSRSAFLKFAISWLVASVLMQIALLGLFIYPIIKRTLWRSNDVNRNLILLQRVRKATIITTVCLVSDILSAALIQSVSYRFLNIYHLNLLINHLATIACFDYWKQMLWPWNCKPSKKKCRPQNFDANLSGPMHLKTKETET